MKRAGALTVAVAVLIFVSGCASLAGRVGIASQQYVDEQIEAARADLEAEISATSDRIDEAQDEFDRYAETAEDLEALVESVQQTVQTTDELKQLAVVLEDRLENLPVDTIRQLVTILEQYLEDK